MTKIKICGIKDSGVVPILNQYLPEYVGFVFAPSAREVNVDQAIKLRQKLDRRIKTVAVLAEENSSLLESLVEKKVIQAVQTHFKISAKQIKLFQQLELEVFQVIRPGYAGLAAAKYWMYDAPQPGSGKLADWRVINSRSHSVILAGGLNPENVVQAIRQVQPQVVDVSSGVETNGSKDQMKIRKFIRSVRDADKEKNFTGK
jgi:phosphoribosylanthranilate isomerase